MKSLILQRNLYIVLWVIYLAQGFFYETGSNLSVTVLLIVMVMSIYYWFKVANRNRLSSTIKCMNIFLLYLSIYGILYIIMGTDYKVEGVVPISSTQYLKSLYISFLPIYAFYFFAKEGIITQKTLQTLSIVLLVLATFKYVYNYQQRVMHLALIGSNREEITNNVSYLFVSLIPLITFWRKKKFVSYLLLFIVMIFIFSGMKRGAILVGTACILLFIFQEYKQSSKKTKMWLVILILIFLFGIIAYVSYMIETSSYFNYRIEQTINGKSSERDIIYLSFLQHFLNNDSFLNVLVGEGAYATVSIGGNYAHNDWLEILINNGIIGVGLYLCLFMTMFREYRRCHKINQYCSLPLLLIIVSLFLTSLFSMSYNSISISISLCLGYCLAYKDVEGPKKITNSIVK